MISEDGVGSACNMKENLRESVLGPTVSVIIPTYERAEVLGDCLKAVLAQSYPNIQIVVTDDSVTDNVESIVGETNLRNRIVYQRNANRLGLPANRNAGLRKAVGALILFVDDDSVMEKDCVEKLVSVYMNLSNTGHRVGAVGPAMISEPSPEGSGILEFGLRSLSRTQSSPVVRSPFTGISRMNFRPGPSTVVEVEELHSNSMYPKEVFGVAGLYEEKLYQGNYLCEETDLHARIRRAGFVLYFNPSARIHHRPAVSGGCRMSPAKYGYYYFRNHAIFIARNHGPRSIYMIPSLSLYLAGLGFYMTAKYATTRVLRKGTQK